MRSNYIQYKLKICFPYVTIQMYMISHNILADKEASAYEQQEYNQME